MGDNASRAIAISNIRFMALENITHLFGVRRPGAAFLSNSSDRDQSGAGPPHSKLAPLVHLLVETITLVVR
jgi:hypothetical protein